MSKDYSLSLRGEAFNSLCADFDTTLRDVLAGMIETEQNTGEINIKVKITLTDDSAPDYTVAGGHQTREVTKPKFDHTVAYVIQRKEKKSGSFSGNFELVFDKASGQYFYRDIDNGQTTLFDGDGDSADFANAQYDVVDEGPRGLPAAPESSVIDGEELDLRTQKTLLLTLLASLRRKPSTPRMIRPSPSAGSASSSVRR